MRGILIGLCAILTAFLPSATAAGTPGSDLDEMAPGIWLVRLEEPGAKAVLAEFGTFLALVESPGDEGTARHLLNLAREHFPGKPVRFLLHTHHHGHSLGTLDPWLASGITIVTARSNLDRLASRTADPDLFRSRALVIDGRFTLDDGSNRLTAWVLPDSDYPVPTEEYTIVHFPEQRVLITGCLYNKPLTYHEVINGRKLALHEFIEDRRLDVERIVPTNTVREAGFEGTCTLAMLERTLVEGIDPMKIADRLEERTVDELRADLDALVAEYGARAPRSYDLIVVASRIRDERDDPGRAIVMFEVAERAFPDDAWVPYHLGRTLFEAGDVAAAESAWERALTRSEDEDEEERLAGAIARVRSSAGS
jgi:hypothetical protein